MDAKVLKQKLRFLAIFIFIFANMQSSSLLAGILEEHIEKYYDQGVRYALLPLVKEVLIRPRNELSPRLQKKINALVMLIGTKNFQGIPDQILKQHQYDFSRFILARKYFQRGSYALAESSLNSISINENPLAPFVLLYLATIKGLNFDNNNALNYFDKCIVESEKWVSLYDDENESQLRNEIKINLDQCILGKARIYYQMNDWVKSDSYYQSIDKKHFVWPSILIEEAWSSFYQLNYNRTLGKITTYRAPQLRFAYKPEVDISRALTYMSMCLYNDTATTVNSFYKIYEPLAQYLAGTLNKNYRDPKYYYDLLQLTQKSDGPFYDLINGAKKSIEIQTILKNIDLSRKEKLLINATFKSRDLEILNSSLNDYQQSQVELAGRIVRTYLKRFYIDLKESFQKMSYIKLSVLGKMKQQIYENKFGRVRGDIKYLKRSDKQYFWSFNGEFWADELGDYVFSLASECNDKN